MHEESTIQAVPIQTVPYHCCNKLHALQVWLDFLHKGKRKIVTHPEVALITHTQRTRKSIQLPRTESFVVKEKFSHV